MSSPQPYYNQPQQQQDPYYQYPNQPYHDPNQGYHDPNQGYHDPNQGYHDPSNYAQPSISHRGFNPSQGFHRDPSPDRRVRSSSFSAPQSAFRGVLMNPGDPGAVAWAEYYARGGTDPAGLVYFIPETIQGLPFAPQAQPESYASYPSQRGRSPSGYHQHPQHAHSYSLPGNASPYHPSSPQPVHQHLPPHQPQPSYHHQHPDSRSPSMHAPLSRSPSMHTQPLSSPYPNGPSQNSPYPSNVPPSSSYPAPSSPYGDGSRNPLSRSPSMHTQPLSSPYANGPPPASPNMNVRNLPQSSPYMNGPSPNNSIGRSGPSLNGSIGRNGAPTPNGSIGSHRPLPQPQRQQTAPPLGYPGGSPLPSPANGYPGRGPLPPPISTHPPHPLPMTASPSVHPRHLLQAGFPPGNLPHAGKPLPSPMSATPPSTQPAHSYTPITPSGSLPMTPSGSVSGRPLPNPTPQPSPMPPSNTRMNPADAFAAVRARQQKALGLGGAPTPPAIDTLPSVPGRRPLPPPTPNRSSTLPNLPSAPILPPQDEEALDDLVEEPQEQSVDGDASPERSPLPLPTPKVDKGKGRAIEREPMQESYFPTTAPSPVSSSEIPSRAPLPTPPSQTPPPTEEESERSPPPVSTPPISNAPFVRTPIPTPTSYIRTVSQMSPQERAEARKAEAHRRMQEKLESLKTLRRKSTMSRTGLAGVVKDPPAVEQQATGESASSNSVAESAPAIKRPLPAGPTPLVQEIRRALPSFPSSAVSTPSSGVTKRALPEAPIPAPDESTRVPMAAMPTTSTFKRALPPRIGRNKTATESSEDQDGESTPDASETAPPAPGAEPVQPNTVRLPSAFNSMRSPSAFSKSSVPMMASSSTDSITQPTKLSSPPRFQPSLPADTGAPSTPPSPMKRPISAGGMSDSGSASSVTSEGGSVGGRRRALPAPPSSGPPGPSGLRKGPILPNVNGIKSPPETPRQSRIEGNEAGTPRPTSMAMRIASEDRNSMSPPATPVRTVQTPTSTRVNSSYNLDDTPPQPLRKADSRRKPVPVPDDYTIPSSNARPLPSKPGLPFNSPPVAKAVPQRIVSHPATTIPVINFPDEDDDKPVDSSAPRVTLSRSPSITINVVDDSAPSPSSVSTPKLNESTSSSKSDASGTSSTSRTSGIGLSSTVTPRAQGSGSGIKAPPVLRKGSLRCAGCECFIVGRIVSAMDMRWHPDCFKCTQCSSLLEHVSSFAHEGRPYCHLDYHELFAPRCYHCKTSIADERFVTVSDPGLSGGSTRYYHELHFFCAECGDPFLHPSASSAAPKGQKPRLHENQENELGYTVYRGHPYCESCHVRLRMPKCAGCGRSIREEVVEALDRKWHHQCFACAMCKSPFDEPSFFQRGKDAYCDGCYGILLKSEM